MANGQHPAPLTVKLVLRVKSLLDKFHLTVDDCRVELNKHLPSGKQIREGHSGYVKLSRWLNPTGPKWPEPRGEIVLAFQKVAEELEKKL